jgi:arylamine N-acetyltransferase
VFSFKKNSPESRDERSFSSLHALLKEYRRITKTEDLIQPTLDNVKLLLKQHCSTFAFSTLAANLGETIIPEPVHLALHLLQNRSGLCFHHNSTVYEVLKSMGFAVELIACQFRIPKSNKLYPIPTHAAIILTTSSGKYLIDPGLGFCMTDPIPLDSDKTIATCNYRVVPKSGDRYELQEFTSHKGQPFETFKSHYEFEYKPVNINEFQDGINTLVKEDKFSEEGTLIEQGHLFFSMFFYSRLIDGQFKSIMALSTNNKKTDLDDNSMYDCLLSSFKPADVVKNKLQLGTFVNEQLKRLVFANRFYESPDPIKSRL